MIHYTCQGWQPDAAKADNHLSKKALFLRVGGFGEADAVYSSEPPLSEKGLFMWGVIKLELYKGARWPSRPDPWVAHIIGHDKQYGYERKFIQGVNDYSHASFSGARGIWRYFALRPGVYEICEIVSWRHSRRYFILVDQNGNVVEIDNVEVDEWLKSTTSE